jgi:hypothetical protein
MSVIELVATELVSRQSVEKGQPVSDVIDSGCQRRSTPAFFTSIATPLLLR